VRKTIVDIFVYKWRIWRPLLHTPEQLNRPDGGIRRARRRKWPERLKLACSQVHTRDWNILNETFIRPLHCGQVLALTRPLLSTTWAARRR